MPISIDGHGPIEQAEKKDAGIDSGRETQCREAFVTLIVLNGTDMQPAYVKAGLAHGRPHSLNTTPAKVRQAGSG